MTTTAHIPKFKEGPQKKSKKADYSKVSFDYSSLDSPKKQAFRAKSSHVKSKLPCLFVADDKLDSKVLCNTSTEDQEMDSKESEGEGCNCSKSTQTDYPSFPKKTYVDASTQTDSTFSMPKKKKGAGEHVIVSKVPEEANISPKEAKPKKKKAKGLFPKLYSEAQIKKGLSEATLFQGVLRVNPKYPSQAYVTIPGFDNDVFICSRKLRNRSLNGDVVTICILTQAEIEEINDNIPTNVVENENKFGKVIGITPKTSERFHVGVFTPSENSKSFVLFKPADKCIPFITIPSEQVPKQILEDPETCAVTLFLIKIDGWLLNSPSPSGSIIRELGPADDLGVGSDAILAECPMAASQFSEKSLDSLPQLPFSFDSLDLSQWKDLRSLPCLTIDPPTARDLDDALSIKKLPDGNFRVWVHIADVSYFVPEGSALDIEAYQRSSTIYLVDKSIPMLPKVLTHDLCSLNPRVDRLALSFSWTVDPDANILASSYCRSIIHSRAKLSYADAQLLIDAGDINHLDLEGYHIDDLRNDLHELLRLSKILRSRRFEQGAMNLGSRHLSFKLEDAKPSQVKEDVSLDSNRLVEEFMLLANRTAAEKLLESFPSQAILRRHQPPKRNPLPDLINMAMRLKIPLEPLPTTIQQFFKALPTPEVDELMRFHAIRSMQRASYVCAGVIDDYSHFALGIPCYTHFTSPIRRYTDILVHRMLLDALSDTAVVSSKEELAAKAAHCSEQKDRICLAQDASSHLYLAHCFQAMLQAAQAAQLPEEATVVALDEAWMDLAIPKYRINRRIHFKDLPLSKVHTTRYNTTLFWLDVPASPKFEANTLDNELCEDSPQDSVSIELTADEACAPQELQLLSKVSVAISVNLKVFPATIALSVLNPMSL
ncbi:hypothetical protein DSO57_1036810 [Entomophthora muscae]|uniref:Uncharacterized protein n=1 Tax=Entomophthora muscae TaxID=34485 RepID=A0ACC2RDS8_9FUNG|nr:hypothetical protein DSO57_1036810 [Entomophthora muscae]